MNKYTKHLILRQYIALARQEHTSASDLGETNDFDVPTAQINWTESELMPENAFERGIISQPSQMENRIICAELRKRYGIFILRGLDGFDKNGDLILPKGRGFIVPQWMGNLITGFEFRFEVERQRAA